MNNNLKWLGVAARLNVSRSNGLSGVAPNKPLLLLSIIDLVEAGKVGVNGLVVKDAELVLRFRSYSPICVKRRGNKIDLDLPFRYLASDGIYTSVGKEEREVILNPEFLALLGDPAFRLKVRKILVSSYFPGLFRVRWDLVVRMGLFRTLFFVDDALVVEHDYAG